MQDMNFSAIRLIGISFQPTVSFSILHDEMFLIRFCNVSKSKFCDMLLGSIAAEIQLFDYMTECTFIMSCTY